MSPFTILQGDCLSEMSLWLEDNSVDAIVTDPPYGLSFMGKHWDYDVPGADVWAECLRVLKPGGHLLSFFGSRTYHRGVVPIEDAGFEIRDQIMWVYGCLDEATEVATENGVMPYHKTKIGDRVLCYDVENGEYTYQPILEIVEYDYSDTAYRLVGDFGEQVVSRNHRVIVERGGSEAFQLAETLECEARVPVLESLPALRQAIHDAHQGAGRPQQDVQCSLCEFVDRRGECRGDAAGTTQGCDDQVRGLRGACVEAECVVAQSGYADVQQEVQRRAARCGVGEACAQRSGALVGRVGDGAEGAHDGRVQPSLEGRFDISQPEGDLRRSADQVRAMSCGSDEHGSGGRLRHGASSCGGAGSWEAADASGVRASHQPRRDEQSAGEPDAVRNERTAQGIRAWGGHRSAVVRVVPFHYTGKVWCLRVPTGAFVAVRNGVAFPTGNSGFPKSHNGDWGGTALKPSHEPIVVARKPLVGTVEANWRDWGTGALNIDGCRVGGEARPLIKNAGAADPRGDGFGRKFGSSCEGETTQGRWPANLIHDGSDEVLAAFPQAAGQQGDLKGHSKDRQSPNGVFGKFAPANDHPARIESDKSAARFFKQCSFTEDDLWPHQESNDPPARSAASLSSACEMCTAAEVVETKTSGFKNEASPAIPACTGSCKRCTPSLNLANADSPESIATTQTTENPLKSNGSAQPAIDASISSGSVAAEAVAIDRGAATRFLYCPKASKRDRDEGLEHMEAMHRPNGNKWTDQDYRVLNGERSEGREAGPRRNVHPTVKPTDLMAYLCRLVTPPGGVILDPFMGSGSTGKAAMREGFRFIGIEREAEYIAIARARILAELSKRLGVAA